MLVLYTLPEKGGTIMDQDKIATNLAVVESHFGSEAAGRVEDAIDLYTDDVVWEAPSRHLRLQGKDSVADNYRQIFRTIRNIQWRCLDRFATEERVVDDSIVTFEVGIEGFIPLPVGTRCEMRLTHIFEMRNGKISKEIGIEGPPRPL
jgi:ketosteroid isomerase-like protein